MNPDVRSTMVGISQVTSPNMAQNTEFLTRVATEAGLSESQITGRASALSSRLGEQGRYLRELGVMTATNQKNIVVGDSSLLLPKQILERASTVDDLGMTVGFLSQEAMASRGNAVRLSIARRGSEDVNPTVNFIYGGRLLQGQKNIRKQAVEAKSLYSSTLAILEETGRSPEAMIQAGLVSSKFEAEKVLETFIPKGQQRISYSL
jgi:hypothetical protein